jgi:hypothetical protein
MDELIKQVSEKLGLEKDVVRKAIGLVLVFLKDHVGKDFDFSQITLNLSGAATMMEQASEAEQTARTAASTNSEQDGGSSITFFFFKILKYILSEGPILDMVKKLLQTFFGEGAVKMLETASDSTELLRVLDRMGVSQEQTKSMVTMLVIFMKKNLGEQVVEQLAESVPFLKPIVNHVKKEE